MLAVSLLSLLGPAFGGEAVPPRFAARVEHDVGGKPEFLAAGDVDRDGHSDLVIALQSPGEVLIARGGGSAALASLERIPIGGYPLRPQIVSWHGAGSATIRTVVAIASRATKQLVLFDLSKAGAPERVTALVLPGVPRAITAGVMGDSDRESIVIALDGRRVVELSEGGELRVLASDLRAEVPRALAIVGGRALVGHQDREAIDGVSSDPPLSFPSPALRDLVAGTFGGAPGCVAVGGERATRVYDASGKCLASFETAPVPVRALVRHRGAGDDEIMTLAYAGVACETWSPARASDGVLSYSRSANVYAGQTSIDMAFADVDGDGRDDLAIANRDARCVSVLSATSTGAFESAPGARVGSFPTCVRVVRVANEAPRLVVLDAKESALSLVAGRESTWSEVERLRLDRPRRLVCADLDGDGSDEVLVACGDAATTRVAVFNVKEGHFVACTGSDPRAGPVVEASAGGDEILRWTGASDALLAERDGSRAVLWSVDADRNRIACALVEPDVRLGFRMRNRRECLLAGSPSALVALRLADGSSRLAVALRARSVIAIVDAMSVENATVASSSNISAESTPSAARVEAEIAIPGSVRDVRAGDFDGDGVLDLAILARVDEHSMESRVYVARLVNGSWTVAAPLVAGLSAFHLICADVDGDGRAEILVAAQDSHAIDLYWPRPAPNGVTFEHRPSLGAGLGCFDIEAADLDGDGQLDLAVANSSSDDVSVLSNRTRR